MVLSEFLNPGCYSQIYMIESKFKAFTCGINEGLHWAIILSFIIYEEVVKFIHSPFLSQATLTVEILLCCKYPGYTFHLSWGI